MKRTDGWPRSGAMSRRLWLQRCSETFLGGVATMGLVQAGCSGETTVDDDGRLRVALADLPLNQRVVLYHGEDPVEFLRTESGVRARSLLCTHFGCEVEWSAEKELYECPCHEALFDDEGRVIAGPPSRPLRELQVEQAGDDLLVELIA